jgi:hypothetical protein
VGCINKVSSREQDRFGNLLYGKASSVGLVTAIVEIRPPKGGSVFTPLEIEIYVLRSIFENELEMNLKHHHTNLKDSNKTF